jgi:putative transposase
MARSPRIHVPGAIYHVTLRGNHRQDIFFTPADRERMKDLIADVMEKCAARIHAYCFMTNHIHAVIQVGDVPLGRLMLRVASPYARAVQMRLDTTGHLFEKRYHPVLVDAETYLLELLRYLHFNPVRGRLSKSVDEYPWSSHHAYNGARSEPWLTTDFALSLFAADSVRAIDAYRAFMRLGAAQGTVESPFAHRNSSDSRILGSDEFAQRMLGTKWKPRSKKSLDDLIAQACELFLVTQAMLESPRRSPALVGARAWVVDQAVTGRIASITAVAKRFNRDESSLRYLLNSRSKAG